ncbi:hypothetical protein ACIP9H_33835 [Streptomyces sp. NPDC088732]|uniref:hypothetical protein n=1 Tax=Streptomyces sp. NPDC088732 TaxID=3365879 RepID=UPI0038091741
MDNQVPYVGGPFDGGHTADTFIDSVEIRRGGSNESGRYVLSTDTDGSQAYNWEPSQ